MPIQTIFPTTIQVNNYKSLLADARAFMDLVGRVGDVPDIIYDAQDVDACKQCATYLQDACGDLTQTVIEQCMEFANTTYYINAGDSVSIKYAWPMTYDVGSTFFPHQHMSDNIKMSAIYYTNVGEGSAPLRFYDQRYFTSDCTQKNLTHDFHPQDGDLLIYPANLIHGVPKNNNNTRRCIVFDVSIIRA